METEQVNCPLCKSIKPQPRLLNQYGVYRYSPMCPCGEFYLRRVDEEDYLDNDKKRDECRAREIGLLLTERSFKGLSSPFLLFDDKEAPQIPGVVPLRVDELLSTWPETVPERIERAFCNVIRRYRDKDPGETLWLDRARDCHIFFTDSQETLDYYMKAMKDYQWVEKAHVDEKSPDVVGLQITPKGWARFGELDRESSIRNPAFVAMCFGGKQGKNKMDRLWLDFIRPAIEAAGYHAKRADTDEHNEPIMDKVFEYIRQAPFVVAELSDRNNGVYYEAGLAKGRGIEVVYCCRARRKPHFDVTAINLVKWKDEEDLRNRLENRIVGTVGQGPHDLRGVE